MSEPRLVWIHSTNETPHCGSGRRHVLAEEGRRWVKLRPANNPTGYADRVSLDTFKRIVEEEATDE